MDFYTILDQVIDLLRQRQRVTYRALQRQFGFDDTYLEDLKAELIDAQRLAVDEEGKVLVWTGDAGLTVLAPSPSATTQERAPLTYTPSHLAEKILTSRSALEGERKLVTVLFADLKGSMELLADRDPEEARQLLDPVLERMMDAVHRYEGTVNQVMGDGIMALFGAPIAHEDHALRACYAALAMQDAIRRYSEGVRRAHGCEVQIRVGLNAGEVMVRAIGNDLHMDYSAVGQTTHLAARMEQLATPGSIRLTAATLRLVEGLVVVRALGPVPVRGLTDPVEVFELVGTSAIRQRLPATVGRGLTRFVGRQTELAVLQQALEQARTGHGQVVAVIGEPGVGKTRLFYEFVHWRDCVGAGRSPSHRTQGWLALETTSMSYGKATTYLPVIDLLNVYFQVEEGDDPRRIREKVTGKLLTLDEALRPTLPAFLSLLEVAVEDAAWEQLNALQRRQHILDAVKSLLLRESQVQPFILVFENLHWIDSETQALLDRLVESLPTARLLLLVNYRPEYQHSWGSKTYYVQLRLDPLLPENAMELLRDLLGEDTSLRALKQRLIAWTEGNPFFLEETVQTLVETHALVGERGAYRLVTSLGTIQVPATVQAVLAARIDRLPLEEKDLLQAAAVIGKDVPSTLLHTIAELPEAALHRGLAHLQAAEFLYETSLFPDLEYTFKHALTQQVAYRSLPHERRRVVHRRVGETLERLYPAQLEEYYEQLAYHYSRSDHQEKALEYLVKTGHKADHRYANREALDAFQQALERVQMGAEYDRILGQCAKLLLGLFRGKEAARDYARLLTSARQRDNRTQELESLLGLASASYIISIDEPLRMQDTFYSAPDAVRARIVRRPLDAPWAATLPTGAPGLRTREHQELPLASGGVYSTAMDMAIFGQMFLNRGSHGEVSILSPAAVAEMTRNQIPGISAQHRGEFFPEASWGFGWGIHGNKRALQDGSLHSPQAFDHYGAGGVFCWVDPVYEIVGVYFSVALELIDDTRSKECYDLFTNAVTAAVVDA